MPTEAEENQKVLKISSFLAEVRKWLLCNSRELRYGLREFSQQHGQWNENLHTS